MTEIPHVDCRSLTCPINPVMQPCAAQLSEYFRVMKHHIWHILPALRFPSNVRDSSHPSPFPIWPQSPSVHPTSVSFNSLDRPIARGHNARIEQILCDHSRSASLHSTELCFRTIMILPRLLVRSRLHPVQWQLQRIPLLQERRRVSVNEPLIHVR